MFIRPKQYVVEVRLKKIASPKKGRRWRWDAAVFQLVEGEHPGVFDCRYHITGNFGYTRTRRGALNKIAESFKEFEEHFNLG